MAKRIPLSFKNTPEEIKLLEEVNKHSCKAAFIKEAIKFYINYYNNKGDLPQMSNKSIEEIPITIEVEDENSEIMDILG